MSELSLRDEMRQGFAEMRHQLAEGMAQLGRRLDALDARVSALDAKVGALDAKVSALDARVSTLETKVTTLDERVRGNGVLLEALREDVRQVAEAYVMLDQRVERYRREHEAGHQEILALLRTSYHDLDRRVTRLEARIEERGTTG